MECLTISLRTIIFFLAATNYIVVAQTDLNAFRQQALQQHNFYRNLHCVSSLTLNASISAIAQNYAQYLADNNLFQHSNQNNLGENLWALRSSGTIGAVNGSRPTNDWYSEVSLYNYNNPIYSPNTGHFTQIIWRETKQIGFGIAYNSTKKRVVVVANYYPYGNVQGGFATNVRPICTGSQTSTTTRTTTTDRQTTKTTTRSPISTTPLLTTTSPTFTSTRNVSSSWSAFQLEALNQHNYRRQMHCVPLMVLNSTLNRIAQNYANYLAANNLFSHSGASGLGENLWSISSTGTLGVINGSRATEAWYGEIRYYNFNSPGYTSGTGHFTQVVWRASVQLGVGIAYSSTMKRAVVVANYFPAGNYLSSFATNVLRVCTNSSSATSSSTSQTYTSMRTTTPTTTQSPISTTPLLTTTSPTFTSTRNVSSSWSAFQLEALNQHNYRRQMHCVPLMVLNSTLNRIAQNYADYLAANNLFSHSGASGLGENLWSMSSSTTLGRINGSRATEDWYGEIRYYNFNNPGFSSGTGHFTQVVWRASVQLGVGIAYSSTMKRVVIVANYYPAGNFLSLFAANVLRVCTNSSSATLTTSLSTASSTSPRVSSTPTTVFRTSTTTSRANSLFLNKFRTQVLTFHNRRRSAHCVGSLVLNNTLNDFAQDHAEYLLQSGILMYSGRVNIGENLWRVTTSGGVGDLTGSLPVDIWYSSLNYYNGSTSGNLTLTNDFTQLIWRGTQQLGVGIAVRFDRREVIVVANYFPRGNIVGQYAVNVPPICGSTTTTISTG